jgi:hypothetical protein
VELRDIEVDERWQQLADRREVQTLIGTRPFYIVHAMMAFVTAGHAAAAVRVLKALPRTDNNRAASALSEHALAPLFCEALLAFSRSDYAACVDWLTRVRHIAHRCGGSLAQCDLIHLTFTEAALRARRARLARALVAERTHSAEASKPAQSAATAAPGDDNAWDPRNGHPRCGLSFGDQVTAQPRLLQVGGTLFTTGSSARRTAQKSPDLQPIVSPGETSLVVISCLCPLAWATAGRAG